MSPLRAVIGGAVTLDRYPSGPAPGGSVLYGARALQACGATVVAVTAMHPAETALRAAFGEATLIAEVGRTTATFENRYDARDRVVQHLHAPAPEVRPYVPAGTELVCLAPVMQELDVVAWAEATPRSALLTLGAQGMLRATRGQTGLVEPSVWAPPEALLDRLDACFLSEEDVRHQPGLIDHLRAALPLLVATHGAHGATAFSAGRTLHVPARRVSVVDPTGAGDTFHATAAARMAAGCSLERALDDATRASAECVSRPRARRTPLAS